MKKRVAFVFLVLIAGIILASCSGAGTAYYRFDNDTNSDMFSVNLGIVNGSSPADLYGTWLSAVSGGVTGYVEITQGTYEVFHDNDTDHSSFDRTEAGNTFPLVAGEYYTILFEDNQYSIVSP